MNAIKSYGEINEFQISRNYDEKIISNYFQKNKMNNSTKSDMCSVSDTTVKPRVKRQARTPVYKFTAKLVVNL